MSIQKKILKGKAWIVGDSIDTDLIVPSKVLTEQDPEKMLAATLELVIPDFYRKVQKGDFIIAGNNFGCGSSREEAVYVLKQLGIGAIIAFSPPHSINLIHAIIFGSMLPGRKCPSSRYFFASFIVILSIGLSFGFP